MIGSILPDFGMAFVPTAQTAYMAPVLSVARDAAVTISPNEYVDFNLKAMSQRPLYGVAVMGSFTTATVTKAPGEGKMCVGANFIAKADNGDPLTDRMWLFVKAPMWMDDWVNWDPSALEGDSSVSKMISKPSHALSVDTAAVDRDPDSETDDWNNVMEKYAQMIYATNTLRGRDGVITGKLRFDICPGTTIRVQSKSEIHSDGVDQLATDLIGFVARVTVAINAEISSAVTTLELTNIRTDAENNQSGKDDKGRYSMGTHPFFNASYFKYAPLVEGLTV